MSKQQSERAPTRGTETVTSDVLSHLVKQFESLSTIKALCAVLAMALAMIAYIYKDFLFGNAVLLYTDIGSDSVNDQLPVWMQRAYIWSETATNSGFSLSSYLGSFMTFEMWNPFQWIIVLSGPGNINKSLIFYAVGQIAAAVIVTHVYFRVLGVAGSAAAIGSLSFAICGYHVLWSAGWSMGMFPVLFVSLGLLATEYYIQERRFSLVAPALAFVVVANSSTYFIVYWATFVSAYALLRLCETKGYRQIVKPALIFLAALAVGAVISWSSLADLYTFINDSGRAESIKVSGAVSTYGTNMNMGMFERASTDEYRSMFGRLLSNNLQGAGLAYRGVMNYLEGPLLYVGLIAVMFVPVFFSHASRQQRQIYGVVLGAAVMFLVFPWFRLAFWGFRLDYFREFTLLISAVVLVIGIRGLHQFITRPKRRDAVVLLVTCIVTLGVLSSAMRVPIHAVASERNAVIILLLCLSLAAILSMFSTRRYIPLVLLVICVVDLSHNAYSTVNNRNFLTSDDIASGKLYGDASLTAIRSINRADTSLFRTVKYFGSGPAIHASINDAMIQQFYGLTGYASIHNKYYLKFMSAFKVIDLADPSQGKWVSSIINRPFLASALGAKYFLTKGKPFGFLPDLFPPVDTVQNVFVHRSAVALPLVVGYDEYMLESDFMKLPPERKDYVIYRSLIASDGDAREFGLKKHYLPATDTSTITGYSFVALHDARRKMLDVSAKTDYSGLYASVNASDDCVAVISVPFDKRLMLRLDGKIVEPKIVNVGFFGLSCPKGKHEISLSVN